MLYLELSLFFAWSPGTLLLIALSIESTSECTHYWIDSISSSYAIIACNHWSVFASSDETSLCHSFIVCCSFFLSFFFFFLFLLQSLLFSGGVVGSALAWCSTFLSRPALLSDPACTPASHLLITPLNKRPAETSTLCQIVVILVVVLRLSN